MPSRLKRYFLPAAAGYFAAWVFTWAWDGEAARRSQIAAMELPRIAPVAAWTDITGRSDGNYPLPCYYSDASVFAPFVVRVRFGWQSSPNGGGGGVALYLWIPGLARAIAERHTWAS